MTGLSSGRSGTYCAETVFLSDLQDEHIDGICGANIDRPLLFVKIS